MEPRYVPKIRGGARPPHWLLEHTDRNMHQIGPSRDVIDEWADAGLPLPDLAAIRHYRLARVRQQLRANHCDAALLYDPLNVRYATDTTNMSIWTMHNQVRFAFVAADGPVVVFEFSKGEFLSAHSEVVDEIRPARSFESFYVGDRVEEIAGKWADEIVELIDECSRSGGRRIAVDIVGLDGIRALEARDVELVSGHQLMEMARLVKSDDELTAMRCAVHSCQRNIDDMRAIFEPGVREVDLWAQLQLSNFQRFGEWVETRLLSSGARTNPWYHEASSKVVEAGEIMGFDTDLIGPYGMCVDMSRSWLCGDGKPAPAQADVFARAVDMIESNLDLFRSGATYREVTDRYRYPSPDDFNGYTVLAHGVGLCDEYPSIFMREEWDATGYDGVFEAGNVLCVEAFVGRKSGGEGVKLEQQIVITDGAPELLTDYPMEL